MDREKDVSQVFDHNENLSVGFFSTVGDRNEQQDSYNYYLDPHCGIFTICDGMGGHQGGGRASTIASQKIVEDFKTADRHMPMCDILIDSARQADSMVAGLANEDGSRMNAGSTMVTVVVQEHQLHWLSVGDSRIYLKRGREFIQITFDHVYSAVLREQLQEQEITDAEYQKEAAKGEALISYIGLGNLELIDYNNEGLSLQSGDIIMMMSDGLYKIVSDGEMNTVLDSFSDIEEITRKMEARAKRNALLAQIERDNMTFAVIKVR